MEHTLDALMSSLQAFPHDFVKALGHCRANGGGVGNFETFIFFVFLSLLNQNLHYLIHVAYKSPKINGNYIELYCFFYFTVNI